MLARARRGDQAQCAALRRRAGAGIVRAAARVEMQDSRLLVLLRCIAARERSAEAWSSRDLLGWGGAGTQRRTSARRSR